MKTPKKIAIVSIICAVVLVVLLVLLNNKKEIQLSYREDTVQYGDLVVGVTQSGFVDIGTVDQVFELDMSALQRASTGTTSEQSASRQNGNSPNEMMGGQLNMFDQLFGMANQDTTSNTQDSSDLVISEVCASVGQQVKEGDVLYYLEEESVEDLKEYLQSNVDKAKVDLDAVYADQILSQQTAQYTYDSSVAYGSYASAEYNTTLAELQVNVENAQVDLTKAEKLLTEYQEQLTLVSKDYEEALQVQKNCEWSRDNTNKWYSPYLYVFYFQQTQTAKEAADSLEQKKEQLEDNVEQAQKNITMCKNTLSTNKRNLAAGILSAEETKQLRQLAYSTAQETYDVALAYLEDGISEQEETYAEASEKWEEFSSHIKENAVCAKYDGVITSVDLAVGDSIHTNDTLITLYNMDEVSLSATVKEADMSDISVGTEANISFTAYPDQIFQAKVTEISDAKSDSNGSVTYEVTVTLRGDVTGLFQGMTGEVTFITKEVKEVLHVSNRAIIRESAQSYVKIKGENEQVKKVKVVTGFSDGVNVEIIEGLSEGDVVLIESKVNES